MAQSKTICLYQNEGFVAGILTAVKWIQVIIAALAAAHRANPLLFIVRCIVLGLVFFLLVTKRTFLTPDTLFLILLAVALVFGQARAFVYRFLPFVALLLVYDSFRGIADDLNTFVHFTEMIDADRWLFAGQLPTAVLQEWWWHGAVQWYDFYFYFLYTMHFVVPILLAVLIWRLKDALYWPYVAGLVILSFGAFITYVAFPAAPPWMASDLGYIEPIHRISSDIWHAMGIQDFSTVYNNLSPNKVAAVPSLHAAYPVFFLLFAAKLFTWRKVWWLSIYPASVWLGIVYLGEHYVVDALLGGLYAVGAYFAALKLFAFKESRGITLRSILARLQPKLK